MIALSIPGGYVVENEAPMGGLGHTDHLLIRNSKKTITSMTNPTIMTRQGFSFAFDPSACETCGGHCCNGESGNIWVTRDESRALADALGLTLDAFTQGYLKKVGYRTSIGERQEGENYACLLYDREKGGCSAYGARPSQCRTFPFWDYFRERPKEAAAECPGVILEENGPDHGND